MEKVEKVKTTFTMDKKLSEEFDNHIEENLLSRSKVIEFLIKEYMDKNKLPETKIVVYDIKYKPTVTIETHDIEGRLYLGFNKSPNIFIIKSNYFDILNDLYFDYNGFRYILLGVEKHKMSDEMTDCGYIMLECKYWKEMVL